ncbi:VOC family protein [Leifsonia poae]|uniref:VOC family protein n=1 Tax=Leifsonia poae TaxID=110933 RepID=UPI001CBB4C79|nr:VOC family protein [Leifsonia poae]
MSNSVVHFEIIGPHPGALRRFYADLFGWDAPPGAPVAPEVSEVTSYSFIEAPSEAESGNQGGIPGGIGGGDGYAARVGFYVGVADVEAALADAERLGGLRVLGPAVNAAGGVVVGHFRDPAGNLIGVAGPM